MKVPYGRPLFNNVQLFIEYMINNNKKKLIEATSTCAHKHTRKKNSFEINKMQICYLNKKYNYNIQVLNI